MTAFTEDFLKNKELLLDPNQVPAFDDDATDDSDQIKLF
jgi:hypothetical protein